MADEFRVALEDLLRKAQVEDDLDFLRAGVQALAQAMMELEVTQYVGAEPYQRSEGPAPFRASGSLPGAHRPDLRRIRVRSVKGVMAAEALSRATLSPG